jgi:hypothetical protein
MKILVRWAVSLLSYSSDLLKAIYFMRSSGGTVLRYSSLLIGSALMFTTFDDNYHSFLRHLNIIIFAAGYFWDYEVNQDSVMKQRLLLGY